MSRTCHCLQTMSLYFDAVSIIQSHSSEGGSFKSRIYNAKNLRSPPSQIYALISESAKWDILLKEVIEYSGILLREQKVRLLHGESLVVTDDLPLTDQAHL
jgi:25S rRNA (cytosine2278-C5)-methyltransferase